MHRLRYKKQERGEYRFQARRIDFKFKGPKSEIFKFYFPAASNIRYDSGLKFLNKQAKAVWAGANKIKPVNQTTNISKGASAQTRLKQT